MNDQYDDELAGLVTDVLTENCTPELVEASEGGWAADLWNTLDELGLTAVGIAEDDGGSGGSLADAITIVRVAARFAAPLPMAHTLIVAPFVRTTFGLPHVSGPTGVALDGSVQAEPEDGGWRIRGSIEEVPYGRAIENLVVLADSQDGSLIAAQIPAQDVTWETEENQAGEPRDRASIDLFVDSAEVIPAGDASDVRSQVRDYEALALTWAMIGAMERVRDLTVTYTTEREQFGRPISRFQAVKQLAATVAGEVAVTTAAANVATDLVSKGSDAKFAVAAARLRAAMAVAPVSQAAHQLHGAIGYTREYPLHFYTRRLWSWRDEGHSERVWMTITGERALANGADKVWETLAV